MEVILFLIVKLILEIHFIIIQEENSGRGDGHGYSLVNTNQLSGWLHPKQHLVLEDREHLDGYEPG